MEPERVASESSGGDPNSSPRARIENSRLVASPGRWRAASTAERKAGAAGSKFFTLSPPCSTACLRMVCDETAANNSPVMKVEKAVTWPLATLTHFEWVPGMVLTERQKRLWVDEESAAAMRAQQCLKFSLTAEDMVGPCLFLASDASRAMTAQSLIVDGGRA